MLNACGKKNTAYPDTAETTKLRAMRTQACIPQFLHTDETSENLSNALKIIKDVKSNQVKLLNQE